MKKLVFRIFILIFPLLIVQLLVFYLLLKTGELTKVETVLERNFKIYGLAYSDVQQEFQYKKLKNLNETNKKIDILVIGGSRTLQFRDLMFNQPFYNAGVIMFNFRDLEFLTEAILALKPKIIIIGCEQYFFNKNFSMFDTLSEYNSSSKFNYKAILTNFVADYFKQKFTLNEIKDSNNEFIGLSAIVKKSGFRPDGSHNYEETEKQYGLPGELFKDISGRIDSKVARYERVQEISTLAVERLRTFLHKCHKNNITVVGFLPSWPKAIIEKLKKDGNYNPYFLELPEILNKEFLSLDNNYFYNFTDIEKYGATDYEFYDGHHASEKIYARMLKYMYLNPKLKEYLNIKNINSIINSKHRFGLN